MYRNGLLWELLNFPKSLGNPDGEMFIRHRAGPCLASWQTTCFERARKLNQNPFGGLGHVRPVDAAIQSLAAAVTLGQSKLFWQTPLVAETVCYNAQCLAVSSSQMGCAGRILHRVLVQEWQEQNTGYNGSCGWAVPGFGHVLPWVFFALCASGLRGCEQLAQTGSYSARREYPMKSEKEGVDRAGFCVTSRVLCDTQRHLSSHCLL